MDLNSLTHTHTHARSAYLTGSAPCAEQGCFDICGNGPPLGRGNKAACQVGHSYPPQWISHHAAEPAREALLLAGPLILISTTDLPTHVGRIQVYIYTHPANWIHINAYMPLHLSRPLLLISTTDHYINAYIPLLLSRPLILISTTDLPTHVGRLRRTRSTLAIHCVAPMSYPLAPIPYPPAPIFYRCGWETTCHPQGDPLCALTHLVCVVTVDIPYGLRILLHRVWITDSPTPLRRTVPQAAAGPGLGVKHASGAPVYMYIYTHPANWIHINAYIPLLLVECNRQILVCRAYLTGGGFHARSMQHSTVGYTIMSNVQYTYCVCMVILYIWDTIMILHDRCRRAGSTTRCARTARWGHPLPPPLCVARLSIPVSEPLQEYRHASLTKIQVGRKSKSISDQILDRPMHSTCTCSVTLAPS